MEPTRRLAGFAAETDYARLPKDVVAASKRCIIDWLGVTVAGSREPVATALLKVASEMGGKRQATVLGKGVKTTLFNAALTNGAMSHVLDYDDVFHPAHSHPAATLFPAITAVAERDHIGGQDVIAAFVAGYEVEARIGEVVGAEFLSKGLHPTANIGAFGAAAGVGNLLGLTTDQMVNGMGIAYTKIAGVVAAFGTMSKSLQVGKSSANGLLAALLAQKGFTGPKEALAGEKGFFQVYLGAARQIADDLGRKYRVTENSFKLYASCGGTHAAVDAALEARRKYAINVADISEVVCQAWPLAPHVCGNPAPKTALEGKFSLQYCVSIALVEGKAGEPQFRDEKVRSPELQDLTRKVKIAPNPAFDDREAVVTIRMKSGKQYQEKTDCVKGNPGNPLSWDDLEGKFRGLTASLLPAANIDRVVKMVKELEELDDINALVSECSSRPPTGGNRR
ncbi:MAG: MmgE/PrpD family protein [Chloroflexota bacterium]